MLYEGCIAHQSIARRGRMAMAFGPLKPVGLTDRTGRALCGVQLRRTRGGDLYNLVGLDAPDLCAQKRVFGMIPGLDQAEYVALGLHRNTFLDRPPCSAQAFEVRKGPACTLPGRSRA